MIAGRIPIDDLALLPFEGMPGPIVQALSAQLAARGVRVRIAPPVPLPDRAFVPRRGQYRAEPLLALVQGHGAPHVLGITHRDLFALGLNFVFGIAHCPGRACVVSTARLLAGADEGLFLARLVKEVTHELGHTLGLDHCATPGCVMYFSNSVADTDRKHDEFCDRCAARLRKLRSAGRRPAARAPADDR